MKKALSAIVLAAALAVGGSASALCVDSDYANLRSGPGTNFSKTWEVYRYMPFKEVEKKGVWHKVKDVDGEAHWIYGKLVSSNYRCAVVKKEKANVRIGPGTEYKETGYSPVLRYYSFKVLEVKGDWVKVVDQDNDEGWIYGPLLWMP